VHRSEERRVEREEAIVSSALEEVCHGRLGKRRGRQSREKGKEVAPIKVLTGVPTSIVQPILFPWLRV
jgi:hypothetical protein